MLWPPSGPSVVETAAGPQLHPREKSPEEDTSSLSRAFHLWSTHVDVCFRAGRSGRVHPCCVESARQAGGASGRGLRLRLHGVSFAVYRPWVVWSIGSGTVTWSGVGLACIVLSGALHLAYSLCLQRGYQVADLSVVYPVARGSAPLMSTVGAIVLLGEHSGVAGIAGLLAIVTAIVLISTQGRLSKFADPAGSAGVRWGTTTGAVIAGCTVVDAYGVKMLGIQPVILHWFSNTVRFAMLLPWFMANRMM